MPQTQLALALEQIYHRLYDIRSEAIASYWRSVPLRSELKEATRIQLLLLQCIAEVAPCPLQKIITRTGLTKGAVSIAARKLAEKGILTITPGTVDRREHIVDLTPAAWTHIRNIDAIFETLLKERMPRYERSEFNAFLSRLHNLNRSLTEPEGQPEK